MSVTFAITRDDIIKYALQTVGAIGEGDTPSATQLTESAWKLNTLVKVWAAEGMPLWDIRTGYVLPTTGTNSINIGGTTSNVVSTYVTFTLTAPALVNATTLTVSSITGISSGDQIGIELSNQTMFWTSVNGAPSGSTVTITSGLSSPASSGANVYTYTGSTQAITRPLRIIDAFIYNTPANSRRQINVITKQQYMSLGGATNAGVPNQVYYDPQLGTSVFYVYPRFSGGDNLVQITYHKEFDDFNSGSDNPDFPQEFYLPLMLALASLEAPKYGLSISDRRDLDARSQLYYEMALSNGTEEGSLLIQPDWRNGG